MHDPHDDPATFIKTPKQLVIVVVLAFAIPITLVALLSQLVTGMKPPGSAEADTQLLSRIKPFGEVAMADASGPKGNLPGEQVFQSLCKTCHEPGIAGAPKVGDKAAWAPSISMRLRRRPRSSPTSCSRRPRANRRTTTASTPPRPQASPSAPTPASAPSASLCPAPPPTPPTPPHRHAPVPGPSQNPPS